MLMKKSGHVSVRSLGKYARPSAEALARWRAETDLTPGRNAILDAFTEPEMRELRPDWDVMTGRVVPHLRSITGAETGDSRLVELVGELSLRSERFRTLWAHPVRPRPARPHTPTPGH
jgi:hypothetical protein